MMWTVKDVMTFTGMSRKAVIKLLNLESCPVLPREKGQTFRIPKEAFIEWLNKGEY